MQPHDLSLYHLIRPSKTSDPKNSPVLFMFHGYGSNEEDLFSFAQALPEDYFIISVRAPYSLMPYGYAWYAIHFDNTDGKWSDTEQALESRDKMRNFIAEACEAYGLDQNKVNLMGFSQGSILSYAVALSYPGIARNVIALSGYINEELLAPDYCTKVRPELAFYVSHGSADQVIPVDWARKTPEILKQCGIPHHYEEFPVGHGVAPQNFHSMLQWLNTHNDL